MKSFNNVCVMTLNQEFLAVSDSAISSYMKTYAAKMQTDNTYSNSMTKFMYFLYWLIHLNMTWTRELKVTSLLCNKGETAQLKTHRLYFIIVQRNHVHALTKSTCHNKTGQKWNRTHACFRRKGNLRQTCPCCLQRAVGNLQRKFDFSSGESAVARQKKK